MYGEKVVLKNLTENEMKEFLVSIGEKNFEADKFSLGYTKE